MSGTAWVFPGQGSQKVGMGQELHAAGGAAREVFERADAALGFSLSRLCFEGPQEELTRTENAQPALYLVSAAAALLLRARGLAPTVAAGHSLGEYSALHAAGALGFEDGLRTVRRRGELMAAIADRVGGGMAAILGLPAEEVARACADAGGVVEVANFNSPVQTVISGEAAAVERAMALAKKRGARRALKLPVAAPFHCTLMAPLAAEMESVLAEISVLAPEVPVIANVTADYVRTPEAVRAALVRQVAGSVRWTETILRMAADGITETVEVGAGRVLTGLTPQTAAGLTARDTAEALVG